VALPYNHFKNKMATKQNLKTAFLVQCHTEPVEV
jgi:hypothetical protein